MWKRLDKLCDLLSEAHLYVTRMKIQGALAHLNKVEQAQLQDLSERIIESANWIGKYVEVRRSHDPEGIQELLSVDSLISGIHENAASLYQSSKRRPDPGEQPNQREQYLRLTQKAQAAAFRETTRRAGGPGVDCGKTIAALIDLDSGDIWVASSGSTTLLPTTEGVISSVKKFEEWPVKACAEVNALDQAVRQGLDPSPRPRPAHIYTYCFTWNENTGKWTERPLVPTVANGLTRFRR